MRRLVVVTALLAMTACADRDQELQRILDEARQAVWRGDLANAQTLSERGLRLSESAAAPLPSVVAWTFRNLKAEVLIARLDLPGAQSILDIAIPADAEMAAVRGRRHYLLAKLQVARGSLAAALKTLDEARAVLPASDHETRPDVEALDAQILFRQGRWGDGESRMQSVLAEARSRRDPVREAVALNDLGMARLLQNQCDEAVSWFERVLNLPEANGSSVYAKALNNAGACLARLGQFDKAVSVQRRAVEMHERGSRSAYEQALGELGTTYLMQNDVAAALPYLQRALSIAVEADQKNDAALWARNLAAAYVYSGQWDEGERYNDEARRLTPATAVRPLLYSTLHTARIAAGRGQHEAARRLFAEALARAADQPSIQWAAHDGLAGVSMSEGRRDEAARHFEQALETIDKTRSNLLKADYRLSFLTDLIRFYRAYVDMLVAQGATDRALEVADSSRGRVLAESHGVAAPARVDVAMIRKVARTSGAVLLSFWLTPARSYVWTVTGHSVQMRELPPAAEIEALVREHQKTIQNSLADPLAHRDTAGDRLFQMLVGAAGVPPGSRVIVVPDGVLHGLNFETLPVDGPSRHYWLEDVVVQVAPSLAMLNHAAVGRDERRPLLMFGNPLPREPEFPALRFAATEMDSIAGRFGSDRIVAYAAERASPAAYRLADVGRFGFVHFTAHATANVESPLDSAIILSGDQSFKLYARDVAALPLAAELVTVSACRSAGERAYSGEGLIGFAWAFLRAGARRVIAGLWDVDDRSTAQLMDMLYAGLAEHRNPAVALRDAKLALIAKGGSFARPYYWGPFQVFSVTP